MTTDRRTLMEPGRFAVEALPGFSMTVSVNKLETEAYFSIGKYPLWFDEKKTVQIMEKHLRDALPFGIDEPFLENDLPRIVAKRMLLPPRKVAA
ncbi:MAG TPA: hypothetical protein PKM25_07230, partial [Candidatus Ozemobacteraceae bacterium]|nr:hypothetical protein [Candidatus Ozemobacteraceae bacterium]